VVSHDKKNKNAQKIAFICPISEGKYEQISLKKEQYLKLIGYCNNYLKEGIEPPKKLGVIGRDVSKSQSPKIHGFIARALHKELSYDLVSIPPEEFENRIDDVLLKYDGLNVTIPYKLAVIPYLEKIADAAEKVGAVNTIVCGTYGYSTDGEGFMLMLKTEHIDVQGKSVLMLGAGGAARAVVYELLKAGAFVAIYSRTFAKVTALCESIGEVNGQCAQALQTVENNPEFDIVINATGVGMHESVGVSPCSQKLLKGCDTAIDLIYQPAKSEFLAIAERNGKKILNGLGMLFYQAYLAQCYYWNITHIDTEQAKELFLAYQREV
jgi:shikimate dehydrogenase